MNETLRKLYAYFNYNEEKGFICTVPTFKENVHLSIGFDNIRKEFNVHFTDDNIKEVGAIRKDYILVMSAFRFLLFINRFVAFYNFNNRILLKSSKTNLGKLKKHDFMIFSLDDESVGNKLLDIKSNGKRWKFRKNIDSELFADGFHPVSQIHDIKGSFFQAYKWKGEHLSYQGIIFQSNSNKSLYYIPKKKYNRFIKLNAIGIYNYINNYPTESTLKFRQLMFEKLKHPYLDVENQN
ncbi:MAG: hypothetical protein GW839_06995 [Flavobacteriales bacterium]|nr:hypothetical protein [Flavobacteriales bacterium]